MTNDEWKAAEPRGGRRLQSPDLRHLPTTISRTRLSFVVRHFPLRFPGLHSLHWKVFVFHLAVLVLPVGYLAWQLRQSLEGTHLQATEEGMIDTAAMAGDLYAQLDRETGGNDPAALGARLAQLLANFEGNRSAKARLFGFTPDEADTRLIFYDGAGRVLHDTFAPARVGQDEHRKLEVRLALSGRYGSRWQLDRAEGRVFIYSTVPVWRDGRVTGAVSVVKPTTRLTRFIVRTLRELLWPALGAVCVAAGLAYVLSAYLTGIVRGLAARAERVAAGEPGVRLETWTRSELGTLARAVERMRERLEGKRYVEETVANLSHELKTPLAAIRGAAELLEDGAAEDPVARGRFLRNIQQETARLDAIVDGLLQLARVETAPAADPADVPPLDLGAAARELAATTYAARAEALGIRFACDVPGSPVPVRLGPTSFRQVVGNLLDNAFGFTPAGRAVRLEVAVEPASGQACLTVRDEGVGIESAILPRVFERFFTTGHPRNGARGTGLGLALVRSLVQAARGTVVAGSEAGQGSVFTVRLPLA